jgi:predicted TIM-barrel fold metal-dependent hydrolase
MSDPVVDSHQHFWDPTRADYPWLTDELARIRRPFGPSDLEPLSTTKQIPGGCSATMSRPESQLSDERA